jgi:diacylglycerol kinase
LKKNNLFQTFLNAFKGIIFVLKTERNFQIEIIALLINLFLMVYFKTTTIESAIILMLCFSVLALELINTAIEKMADFVEPNFNPKIGIIKDIAAGAVLMAAILSVVVGFIIYRAYILELI